MDYQFVNDERLGIPLPDLFKDWESIELDLQEQILMEWEEIRGGIPNRIKELEVIIRAKQACLEEEENFERSCELNWEIAELASIINDLWIWFRANHRIESKLHQ